MAQRPHGEGSISKRGTGKWCLRGFFTDPLTGTRVRKSKVVAARTRTEAIQRLKEWQAEVEQDLAGRVYGAGDGTLSALAEDWLEHIARAGGKAPTTVAMYRRHLKNHVLPTLGQRPVRDVGARQLDTLYAQLVDKGLSPTTVETIHWVVSSMLRQAKRWKMITEMPEATVPTARTPEVEPPTPQEVQALIDKAEERTLPDIALLIRLAALTGARRGELCGIQVSDLDWDKGTLTIQRQIQVEFGVMPPKGGKGRVVALGPALITELQDYLGHERDVLEREPGPWLFSRDEGKTPIDPRRVSETISRLGRACGVQIHTHSLRHFHDTYLMAQGIDDVTIARRAGHNTEMARRVYMHRVEAADVRAAETLEQVLSGVEPACPLPVE